MFMWLYIQSGFTCFDVACVLEWYWTVADICLVGWNKTLFLILFTVFIKSEATGIRLRKKELWWHCWWGDGFVLKKCCGVNTNIWGILKRNTCGDHTNCHHNFWHHCCCYLRFYSAVNSWPRTWKHTLTHRLRNAVLLRWHNWRE
jgi:hypothetical protein